MATRKRRAGIRRLSMPAVFFLLALLSATLFRWQQRTISLLPVPDGSSFEIHFLDVGQADAALVLCNGEAMLIDGGNAADSAMVYAYLKEHNISHLNYIVCTHPHEDHVGGLAGALNFATVDTALCPVTSYDSRAFASFLKYLEKQNSTITVPTPGDCFMLGCATVTVLGPASEFDNTNDTSLVLRIVYGETSFLFTGDAEDVAEDAIIASGCPLSSTVLKVGHHGSDSSSSNTFLQAVSPLYAVISVGNGNSYGHPSDEVLSRLASVGAEIYRTDLHGTIICTSDGQHIAFSTEKDQHVQQVAQRSLNNP